MIAIDQSALLVIDIQDSFKVGERWERRNNPKFEENVAALIAAYRRAGLPVFYVLHSDADGDEWRTTSPHYKLMDFLKPLENEPLLHKTSRNAFTSTNLQRRLTQLGVRRLIVTGIQTEQCCETTARVGADLGYDVDFVTEATLTFPIQLDPGDWSRALPADAVVERTEYALRRRFARIATVREILDQVA
jgi:nicotinamidase-related amidase